MTFWSEKRRRRRRRAATALSLSLVFCSLTLSSVAGAVVKGAYFVAGTSHLIPIDGIDTSLYTHMYFASAKWDNSSAVVTIAIEDLHEMQTFSGDMKRKNPSLLTLISVSTTDFSPVLQYQRLAFINSSIGLARDLQYDGIDLNWQFPQCQEEMDLFRDFLELWRKAVDDEAKQTARTPLLLTAMVYFYPVLLYIGEGHYPVQTIARTLDFINLRCFDFHGPWDLTRTGANANIYEHFSKLSTDAGVSEWLDEGFPGEQIVVGVPLYGRSWILIDQERDSGLGAPAYAKGPIQPYSLEAGYMYYFEVFNFVRAYHPTVVRDLERVTGYCFVDNVWITYVDKVIVAHMSLYVKHKGYRGYFVWHLSQDNNFDISRAASKAWDTGEIPNN